MFVCLSPGGQSLTVGESAKDKLLVGTVNGVFSFVKNNGGWNRQETMLPDQHISAIIFEPSSQRSLPAAITARFCQRRLGQKLGGKRSRHRR
jgi:hypothetical protein